MFQSSNKNSVRQSPTAVKARPRAHAANKQRPRCAWAFAYYPATLLKLVDFNSRIQLNAKS